MGLKLCHNGVNYLIINIYLIYDNGSVEHMLEYISNLSELNNILAEETFDHVLIGGDFNCDPYKGRFFEEANKFANNNALQFVDILNLPNDTYTYISENSSCSTSWIDHFMISDPDIIDNIEVLYGSTFADHIPIKCDLHFPCDILTKPQPPLMGNNENIFLVEWSKCNTEDKNSYLSLLDLLIDNIESDTIFCQCSNCSDPTHLNEIDKLFECLKHCILEASMYSLPSISNRGKFRIVPGWNEQCRDLYYRARDDFLLWKSLGRIRTGVIFQAMKESRKVFKQALNNCKANEMQIRKEKIIISYNEKSKIQFWKNVRQFTPKSNKWVIDGKFDSSEIANIFTNNYKSVLDNSECHSNYENVERNEIQNLSNLFFQINNINEAISNLKQGIGFDRIHANHLKFAGPVFKSFLGKLYSSCLRHSYLPHDIIKGVIKPVLKGTACKSKSENFRPVMNSSVLLKTLEYCLMPTLKSYLQIDPLQFGFQHGSSCDHAITVVKETILNYKKGSTNVHAAAIDLTKAYDRVNHDILISKLLDAGTPTLIVKILQYMLRNTFAYVDINGTYGDSFRIMNGVRQGGCLSSLLFAYYINQVIVEIKNTGIGCKLLNETTNIIAFADDIILLAPTFAGLRKLLGKTYEIVDRLCLTINVKKSKYIIFKHKRTVKAQNVLKIGRLNLEKVSNITYLGIVLSEDLDLSCDVDRTVRSFLGQFNSLMNKFNFLSGSTLGFLFKTYCCSFYGVNLWFESDIKIKDLRKIEIVFHKAVKKVVNMRNWESNHDACDRINLLLFKHMISHKLISCYSSFINAECNFFFKIRYYMMLSSHMYTTIKQRFDSMYGISMIINNDIDSLKSRIAFIHRTEPRSNHIYEP